MIEVQADEFKKSVEEAARNIKKKLESAVALFAGEMAAIASANTPIGDADSIITNKRYARYYASRREAYGIAEQPGYHKGAWTYSEGVPVFTTAIHRFDKSDVSSLAGSSYNLGDTFMIAATGPGYSALNAGSSTQAPRGILQPSLEQIVQFYSINFAKLYENQG